MKETLSKITCAVKGIAAALLSVFGLLIVVQALFGASAPVNVIGNLQGLLGGFVGVGADFTSFVTLVLVVALIGKLSCEKETCTKSKE
tara:strand:+ start:271 stop:534 length:264 start_codon:yes stop_codon:yes gene_type:complete